MPQPPYQVLEIQQEWVLEPEALGSKEKFWYQSNEKYPEWLFKYPQENTGQHWAEKIAAEVAAKLRILHARVELAAFQGVRGSATESFARRGRAHPDRSLFHGNQILAGQVLVYDPSKKFQQSDHTLANIFAAIDKTFLVQGIARKTKVLFASYIVLDAVIGNTDRHHENWGILIKQVKDRWEGILAPTFDHASSLGRELVDAADGPCRERLLREERVGAYSERAHGGIFWDNSDKRGVSPLELVRRAAALHPEIFKPALGNLERLDRQSIRVIIDRIPDDWMTPVARQFAEELMCYNWEGLRKIQL